MSAKSHAARLRRMRNTEVMLRELYAAGQDLEITMRKGIVSGSISGANHVPGPPGGYPNADSRDLDTKIDTRIVAQNPPQVNVTAHSQHAVFVNFGTSRMEARPFASLATNEAAPRIRDRMRRAAGKLTK